MNAADCNGVITALEWTDAIDDSSATSMTVSAVDHLDGIKPEMNEG